jgi:hypothetical protein
MRFERIFVCMLTARVTMLSCTGVAVCAVLLPPDDLFGAHARLPLHAWAPAARSVVPKCWLTNDAMRFATTYATHGGSDSASLAPLRGVPGLAQSQDDRVARTKSGRSRLFERGGPLSR